MGNKIDWTSFPAGFEARVKWSIENIDGYKESLEKYSPHLKYLI